MPCLPGQLITAAVAAGSGITLAPGGQQHRLSTELPAVLQRCPHRPAILQQQAGNLAADQGNIPLADQACQSVHNIPGAVGNRKDPVAPLGLEGDPQAFKQFHRRAGRKSPDGAGEKFGILADILEEILRGTVVGEIAAALACDQDLSGRAFPGLQHPHLQPLPGGETGSGKARGPTAYDNQIILLHSFSPVPSVFS